jgi:hypothetical protein
MDDSWAVLALLGVLMLTAVTLVIWMIKRRVGKAMPLGLTATVLVVMALLPAALWVASGLLTSGSAILDPDVRDFLVVAANNCAIFTTVLWVVALIVALSGSNRKTPAIKDDS